MEKEELIFSVIDQLCLYIEMNCIVEGVFRIPGDQEEAQKIINSLLLGDRLSLCDVEDPHSVSSALKLYFRSTPVSLFGPESYSIIANMNSSVPTVIQYISQLLQVIPPKHKIILKRIIEMMRVIIKHEDVTKMTPKNLG